MTTILFDLDGTLIDSTEAILESFKQSFNYFNLKNYDDEQIKSLIGYPLDIMYEKLGIKTSNINEIVEVYKNITDLYQRKKQPFFLMQKRHLRKPMQLQPLV